MKAEQFRKKEQALKAEILAEIRAKLGEEKIHLGDNFEDEANNELFAVDKDDVFFNEDGVDCYPLEDLGINDAIAILYFLE